MKTKTTSYQILLKRIFTSWNEGEEIPVLVFAFDHVAVMEILIDILVAVGAAEVGNTAVRIVAEVFGGTGANIADVV